MSYEDDYRALVAEIIDKPQLRNTRNDKNSLSVFAKTLKIDCLNSFRFPILKGRKMYYKGVLGELAAFLNQPKHVDDFTKAGCHYWEQWANEDGSLELDYGNAWFDWNGVDQFERLIKSLKEDPTSRRHIISGWRPDRLDSLSLPCCHILYQFYVRDGKLDCIWYMRSVDVLVGLPSDVILAAALLLVICKLVGLEPGSMTFMMGDVHIYSQHATQALLYLTLDEGSTTEPFDLPRWTMTNIKSVTDFNRDTIELVGYKPSETKYNFEVVA